MVFYRDDTGDARDVYYSVAWRIAGFIGKGACWHREASMPLCVDTLRAASILLVSAFLRHMGVRWLGVRVGVRMACPLASGCERGGKLLRFGRGMKTVAAPTHGKQGEEQKGAA